MRLLTLCMAFAHLESGFIVQSNKAQMQTAD